MKSTYLKVPQNFKGGGVKVPAGKEFTISKLNKVTSFINMSHPHNLQLPPKLTERQDGTILRLLVCVLVV